MRTSVPAAKTAPKSIPSSARCWMVRRSRSSILESIRETQKLDDDTRASLEKAVADFKRQRFAGGEAHDDRLVDVGHEAEPEDFNEEDLEQAQIVRQRR